MSGTQYLAGIEAGGTTFVVGLFACPVEAARLAETEPVAVTSLDTGTDGVGTVTASAEWIRDTVNELGGSLAAVGVASFGPVDLAEQSDTYGYITSTPKPGWEDTPVVDTVAQVLGVPVAFETDVNAAALAEAQVMDSVGAAPVVYITVGTGVGVGVALDTHTALHGILHPEAGHMVVPIAEGDADRLDAIHVCPFHAACVEGFVASRGLAARFGVPASELASVPDDHPGWDAVAHYLGLLAANITLLLSPHAIIIGGGILNRASLYPKIRACLVAGLGGYLRVPRITQGPTPDAAPASAYILPPKIGNPGLLGAALIAQRIL